MHIFTSSPLCTPKIRMKEKSFKRLLNHKGKAMEVVESIQHISGSQEADGSLATPLAEQRMFKTMCLIVTSLN